MTDQHPPPDPALVAARRIALGLVMAVLDQDQDHARILLADLDWAQIELVMLSLAAFAVEIVDPDERAEFREECADEALMMSRWEPWP